MLIMILFMLSIFFSTLAIASITLPQKPSGVTDIDPPLEDLLQTMPGASFWLADVVAEDEFDAADWATLTGDLDDLAAGLTQFTKIGKFISEESGSYESDAELLKFRNGAFAGKRTNKVVLSIVGLTLDQKNYFESSEFEHVPKVALLLSDDENDVLVIANKMWKAKVTGKIDGLWAIEISTEFGGRTNNCVWFIKDIPEATP